jgi:hypothetical protein
LAHAMTGQGLTSTEPLLPASFDPRRFA